MTVGARGAARGDEAVLGPRETGRGWAPTQRSRGGRVERSKQRTDQKQKQVGIRGGRGAFQEHLLKASRGGRAGEGAGRKLTLKCCLLNFIHAG